ncbi:MFS transporter [Saliterribacillus persicus]|uniref:Fucose permease n=1 Tax=Saliterribacillus persicus TaxID=930114 RepID=A0A368XVA8_9BACI|nr:MFS transporter [Saliterribacillus persicus]RCW71903.1 fucose permease [Saliterribacillus persicus]
MKITAKTNYYLLLFVIFGGFLIFGVSENIKGPALPEIQNDFTLSEGKLAILLAINAFGFLLACLYTSWLINKIGVKITSVVTLSLMALSGVFIYLSTNFATLTVAYFLLYIGNGMLEIGLAIIAARLFTKNTGTMLNLSHFFYGLGSTVAPIVAASMMGWTIQTETLGWNGMYLIMLSLSLLPIIPVLLSKFPKDTAEEENRTSIKSLTRDPIAWLIVFALTMGVTAELGMAAWLVNYLVKVDSMTLGDASGMLSLFFLFFMLARLLLGPITDKFGYTISIIVFSIFAFVCATIPIFTGGAYTFLFALAGLGIGPIYPTMMALLAKNYTNGTDTAITFTVSLIGIGTVITNLLIGYVIELVSGFSLGDNATINNQIGLQAGYLFIAITALLCALACVVMLFIMKKEQRVL